VGSAVEVAASLIVGLSVAVAILTDDIVEITATAVRRRSHLSGLLGRGFRAVDLEPGSWYVRSKYNENRVLWVGSRPHSSPKQEILTFSLRFEDDPTALDAPFREAGAGIEDEHADWLRRRLILARLEMAILPAWSISVSAAWLGLLPNSTAGAPMALAFGALVVVHLRAR
jgi:hypothetical protein